MNIEITEVKTKQIVVPNLYGDQELYDDIIEQVKLWGDKFWEDDYSKGGIDLDTQPTSKRIAYLPDTTRKLWRRHLIMTLTYLKPMFRRDKEKLKKYLNKRFGEYNWFYDKWNTVKIVLVKNILKDPYSTLNNKWSCKLSKCRKKIFLTKVQNEEKYQSSYPEISDEKIGKGFFYKE